MSETTQQLLKSPNKSYDTIGNNQDDDNIVGDSIPVTSVKTELKIICKASAPLIVTFFLQYSLSVVSIFAVGHIGSKELAAVSLATMTFNVTSSIFNGMATCLDTFCAQAYGAGNILHVGLYFQRCTVMICAINIPLVLFWWNSAYLFKYVVTDIELAFLAQTYLRVMAFSTPAYIAFETGKRFLQAQDVFVIGQYCLFLAAPLNIFLNYTLVWNENYGLGFIGAPIATTISYWVMSITLLLYCFLSECKKCWPGFKPKECFKDWGEMMGLALNGTAMLLSEFIAFEILTLASARFGTETLAAQSISSTVATLSFQVPFSTSVAASTRIANLIGGGFKESAIISTKTTYYISCVLGVFNFAMLFFFKEFIVCAFTEDTTVRGIGITILTILAVNQLYDCPNVIGAGCLRAQGRQYVGSRLNLVAYYIIAVPLALYLGFTKQMNVKGLWIGLGCGVFVLALSELYFVITSPWDDVVEKAKERNSISSSTV